MGVDCHILLPNNVRLDDVSKVIGVLCGNKVTKTPEGFIRVSGVTKRPCHETMPECADILVDVEGSTVQREKGKNINVLYHFEPSGGHGRLMLPRSTAFWIAMGRRLVDFFGGTVEYNDCDAKPEFYSVKEKSNDQIVQRTGKNTGRSSDESPSAPR